MTETQRWTAIIWAIAIMGIAGMIWAWGAA